MTILVFLEGVALVIVMMIVLQRLKQIVQWQEIMADLLLDTLKENRKHWRSIQGGKG